MSLHPRDFTLDEIAELRRFTPRYLRELVRRHSIPVLRSGRLIRFDELALRALEDALRAPCRSKSPAVKPPALSPSRARLPVSASRRASSDDLTLAREEAAVIEADILRAQWHGERRGSRTFDQALVSYLEALPRHENTKRRLRRIRSALGPAKLAGIDQDAITKLVRTVLPPGVGPATITRELITPLRAVLRHAHRRGWCDAPVIDTPRAPAGRTILMMPEEAERLVRAAADHLRPLVVTLLGTGMRLAEAIYLDWRDVDLLGARVILHADRTKSRRRRVVELPPRVVAVLAALPHRVGSVFWTDRGKPYTDRGGQYGGQIKKAWRSAIKRAGLSPEFTPHICRHTSPHGIGLFTRICWRCGKLADGRVSLWSSVTRI